MEYVSGRNKERSGDTIVDVPLATEQGNDDEDTLHLAKEEQQQLAAWNPPHQRALFVTGIHRLVEEQAALRPDALALVAGNQTLSYKELNSHANQLARYLRVLGAGPDVLVGLCVERSAQMVIGLLGILKAGAAYLPLDSAYPSGRLAFMVEDAHAPILLTQQRFMAKLPASTIHTFCLDDDRGVLAQQSDSNLPALSTADDLVYVIYTSGSTGQPKGVEITQRSLLNLVYWHQKTFGLTVSDRTSQIASPAFDATGWELWPSLCNGASIHLVDEQIRTTPLLLRDWLVRQQITISFLPTALAEGMLDLEWPAATALRVMLTGAEALHRYPRVSLPFALVNNYGPTEATVVATSGSVLPGERQDVPPSIGCPIANTEVYLLDEQLRQVPVGEPGEVHIGGIGLARGYRHRVALTQEKFIPHPFSSERDARLYKTGDLARYLPDGQLAFLGRKDDQVKLRGYRIEPGEIVTALNQHPAIQTSLAIAREDSPGEKRLVAYVVVVPDVPITPAMLQEHLLARLPEYMVPAAFVHLEALPLTPNGKVDRNILPAPNEANTLQAQSSPAPGTSTEAKIAEMVSALLHVEQVGIDENIFLLGGHSMLGAQLVMGIAETFGVDLPLRTLFEAPSVRQLAAEVERRLMILEVGSERTVKHQLR